MRRASRLGRRQSMAAQRPRNAWTLARLDAGTTSLPHQQWLAVAIPFPLPAHLIGAGRKRDGRVLLMLQIGGRGADLDVADVERQRHRAGERLISEQHHLAAVKGMAMPSQLAAGQHDGTIRIVGEQVDWGCVLDQLQQDVALGIKQVRHVFLHSSDSDAVARSAIDWRAPAYNWYWDHHIN